ncbi:aldose 1-epimerase [Arenibaculum sp.]|uniref:aldose 1-epimerase n=1 Tax=Arenibaculum sp. TaxID=2865862 RepID=UPI002E0D1B21|nr:aldose 1-epimerase [Arenibaculum sp.]
MADIVSLRAGDLAADLAPSIGGAVVSFRLGDLALMRPTPAGALAGGEVRLSSCYPLVPYSNRIARGRFAFGGETFELAPNFGDYPHSIHGNAWQAAWTVERADAASCVLSFMHDPAGMGASGWPFAYRAEQRVELAPDGLTIALSVENRDRRPMPAGIGLHPYFIRRPGTTLRFQAAAVWANGADSLPAKRTAIPAVWDFSSSRPLGWDFIDNCFAGWTHVAEIGHPNENLSIRIDADQVFGHLVVFVPEGRDFFAVEPVSHMNDAVNRRDVPDAGLVTLEPGGRLGGAVRFSLQGAA